jgi:hypothetical protein
MHVQVVGCNEEFAVIPQPEIAADATTAAATTTVIAAAFLTAVAIAAALVATIGHALAIAAPRLRVTVAHVAHIAGIGRFSRHGLALVHRRRRHPARHILCGRCLRGRVRRGSI